MKIRVLLVILAMVAVACGGAAAPDDSVDADETVETTEPGPDGADSELDTLADFFGGSDDPEQAQAQYREQEARLQEAVRLCMAEEGFDYIPVEPPADDYVFDDSTQEEFAAEQGFGITTWVGNEDEFVESDSEWVDPNQEIVEAMSDSEREAYYEALYGSEEEQQEGTTVEVDPETGEEVYFQEGFGAGCYGEAAEAEYGGQDDLWEELGPEVEAMYERMQADPRIVEANQEWSACMADEGYDYESPDAMYETVFTEFQTRLDEIVGPNGGYVDPFEGWTEEEISAFFEEKTEDEINAFFEETQNQEPDYDQEALAALQEEEIELAVLTARCSARMEDVFREVSEDYEADFVNEHRDELEAIKASQGGSN